MPALSVNGLTIPILADSFNEQIVDTGDVFRRATTGKMFGTLGVRKRRWSFTTRHLSGYMAGKVQNMIEGNALSWTFNDTLISGAGVANTNAATVISYVTGFHGKAVRLSSGTFFSVDMANKVNAPGGWDPSRNGWTLMFRLYCTIAADGTPADGWYHFVVTGTGDVIAGAAANPVGVTQYRNGVAGNYNLGRVINVDATGDFVGVKATTLLGVNANKDYDELVFLPFPIPTAVEAPWTSTWASQFYDFSIKSPWGAAPIVIVEGDHIDLTEVSGLVSAMCRVERIRHVNATMPGSTSKPNVKLMDVVVEEA